MIKQKKEWFTIIDGSHPKITDLYKRKCIKVAVYHNDYKGIPFASLSSRNVVAEFLSFYGSADDVACLMQKLSHLTRAFYIRDNRLAGFLCSGKVTNPAFADFKFQESVLGFLRKNSERA